MRYRLMATYQGSPFEAGIGPTDGDIVLFAACPPPEELGFEPATGHWRKQLRFGDVQAVWESRPVGMFRGERCMVLDDLGDRLHIGYLGHDGYKAEQLGYWQVDRGVFELVAPRTEVSDILEERTEYRRPVRRSSEPAARPGLHREMPRPYDSASSTRPAGWHGSAPTQSRRLSPHPTPAEATKYRGAAAAAYSWQPEQPPGHGASRAQLPTLRQDVPGLPCRTRRHHRRGAAGSGRGAAAAGG